MADHLAAFDDQLCERLRHCLACGCWSERPWVTTLDLPSGLSVAAVQCTPCYEQDRTFTALRARLEARYERPCAY